MPRATRELFAASVKRLSEIINQEPASFDDTFGSSDWKFAIVLLGEFVVSVKVTRHSVRLKFKSPIARSCEGQGCGESDEKAR